MIRRVIEIDEEKCTDCRLCVDACHEGAIGMVDGKARLLRDDYCDGLGDCLPACPTGAITFIEREADAYDEAAVIEHLAARTAAELRAEDAADGVAAGRAPSAPAPFSGCPGSRSRELGGGMAGASFPVAAGCAAGGPAVEVSAPMAGEAATGSAAVVGVSAAAGAGASAGVGSAPVAAEAPSRLMQWPAQIKLVPVQAPYYEGRGLLIAADCTAFACASFHERFMRGKVTVIGCPKLDEGSYVEKLAAIIAANAVTSVTVARMEVPCCGGLERAAAEALAQSGKSLPFEVVTFSVNGEVLA